MRGRQAVFSDPEGAVFAVLASSSGDLPDYLAAPGEWIWSSLLSKDPATEAAFYQQLFAYDAFDLESNDGMQHVILSSDDFARGSVNTLPGDSALRRAHWLNFVRVDDVVAVAAKAQAAGGRVLVAPHVDRHGGWGGGYRVGPGRGGDRRGGDRRGNEPPRSYRPAPASRPTPSIPSHPRDSRH